MTRLAIVDLETTGFKSDRGHRIVEVCVQLWDVESRTMLRELATLVNPLREIPADASRVNHIFTEDLVDAPTWDKVAPAVNAMLSKADIFVAHNSDFDSEFVLLELMRVGITPKDLQVFCTMRNARWATANGKNPKLAELCWALEVPYDPALAHRATYDVTCTAHALWKGIDLGHFKLPALETT